jgi:polar amino acid transport system substrate-binding protein
MNHSCFGRQMLSATMACALLLMGCESGPASKTDAAAAPDGLHLVNPGKLTVCTNLPFEPFQFNRDGKIVGFDVDIVDLAAAKLGVTQEIVMIDFAVIKSGAALNSGKCDLAAAGMTITDERKKNLDFSVPYFEADQALMTKKGSGVASLEDVKAKGLKLGALANTTGLDYAKRRGFDPIQFADAQKVLLSLETGRTDVIIIDIPVVLTWLKKPDLGAKYELAGRLDTGEQFGIAMKMGNTALARVINEAIESSKRDGSYAAIYRKWFGVDPTPPAKL